MLDALYKVPRFTLSATSVAAVLYLTLFPRPLGEVHIPLFAGADKVVHGLMFFGVAFCLAFDWRTCRRAAVSGFLTASVLGGLIEIAQWKMDLGRSGDWWDLAADVAGAAVGVVACRCVLRKR